MPKDWSKSTLKDYKCNDKDNGIFLLTGKVNNIIVIDTEKFEVSGINVYDPKMIGNKSGLVTGSNIFFYIRKILYKLVWEKRFRNRYSSQ